MTRKATPRMAAPASNRLRSPPVSVPARKARSARLSVPVTP
ncbi:Uncharacterised protein [Bordetella pertussis]|nr:Uncharacterised protein [Bordetella pertussis]